MRRVIDYTKTSQGNSSTACTQLHQNIISDSVKRHLRGRHLSVLNLKFDFISDGGCTCEEQSALSLKRHLFPHGGREPKAFWTCSSRVRPPSEIKSNYTEFTKAAFAKAAFRHSLRVYPNSLHNIWDVAVIAWQYRGGLQGAECHRTTIPGNRWMSFPRVQVTLENVWSKQLGNMRIMSSTVGKSKSCPHNAKKYVGKRFCEYGFGVQDLRSLALVLSAFLRHAFRQVASGFCEGTVPGAPPLPSPGPLRMPRSSSRETYLVPPEGHILVKNMWSDSQVVTRYRTRGAPFPIHKVPRIRKGKGT